MLCAYDQQRDEILATQVQREDGPFSCPACHEPVIFKKGRVKIPHFAHLPNTDCSYAGQGESEEHRTTKLEIYQALLKRPGVSNVKLERYLQDVRPDVSFEYQAGFVAIEVQMSTLSRDDIERRTMAYASKNIALLWTPPLPLAIFKARYAPRDWERYLHGLYYGKIYYWSEHLRLQPVKFNTYILSPSWYSNEKPSKRFVTPEFQLSCPSILDLVPTWRASWRTYPRAKLLMEAR